MKTFQNFVRETDKRKMASKKKHVQKSLGAFGFTKKVFHRGQFTKVEIPDKPIEEMKLKCEYCFKRFKNAQGLGVHLKCVHGNDGKAEKSDEVLLTSSLKKRKALDELENIENEVGFIVNSLVNKVNSYYSIICKSLKCTCS